MLLLLPSAPRPSSAGHIVKEQVDPPVGPRVVVLLLMWSVEREFSVI